MAACRSGLPAEIVERHPPLFRDLGPVLTGTSSASAAIDRAEVARKRRARALSREARGRRIVLLRIAGAGGPELAREVARRLALHRRVYAAPADGPLDGAYAFLDGRLEGNRVRFSILIDGERKRDSVVGDRLQLEGRLMRRVARLGRRK